MSAGSSELKFLNLDEAVDYMRTTFHTGIDERSVLTLVRLGLLPGFGENLNTFLQTDLERLGILARSVAECEPEELRGRDLFLPGVPTEVTVGSCRIPFGDGIGSAQEPSISPALRVLIQVASTANDASPEGSTPVAWLGGTCIVADRASARVAKLQAERQARVAVVGATDFARTAYYMGTKRELGPFLVEALATVLPADGVVLDLMCGSGAASGAFSRVWRTYASDAQAFSRHLAIVQGGGYSATRASECLSAILKEAREHEARLRQGVDDLLRRELELCHSDITEDLLVRFRSYVEDVPSYPGAKEHGTWNPSAEVLRRPADGIGQQYFLFSAYFPTLFFGLRQAIEIDSLRFAVDKLKNDKDRDWALGALIVATSVRATTYAAHFAQPPIRHTGELSLAKLSRILEGWSCSIYHEFAVRMERLGLQSESANHPVLTLEGPWQNAIERFAGLQMRERVVVYVDAPYTREEYSRYYHVLETLVRYDYPSATGRGKVPSKARAERFASELFTRTREKVESHLIEIIQKVLANGWICAWSYSSSGKARIVAVIEGVSRLLKCRIESFVAPHRHNSQKGKKPKDVLEYLILFVPE